MDDKKELFKDIQEYISSEPYLKFVKLLHTCIHDLRIKNDTAEAEDTLRNQGAISELKRILRGISRYEKYKEYTGGFDE
ncbi:MAG: hypothetical protein GWN62_34170 [Aliifodinibius sp.]|nr:hypothetical protein [Fodinibius sp.]